jgi:nucleoside-diphosphate-sugar epimerase
MKLNVLLTGATGMIGRGVLLECLKSDEVISVLSIGRSLSGESHPKLKEVILSDFRDLGRHSEQLKEINACFFCLGISSAGISEEEYSRITYGMTKDFAEELER